MTRRLEIAGTKIIYSAGILLLALYLSGCDTEASGSGSGRQTAESGGKGARGPGGGGGGRGSSGRRSKAATTTAVPVHVESAGRRSISEFLETNGVLEAENEVDIIARVAGPIVELTVEEGMEVETDQLLARIDDREFRSQVAIATVSRDEAQMEFDRAQTSLDQKLISRELYDSSAAKLDGAEAQLEDAKIQLDYTKIRAPFSGMIINRYIKQAEHLISGASLFRVSAFKPLLCPIRVPEKELTKLQEGQRAFLEVQAFAEKKFLARVLRISPVVDATNGTIKVTLDVETEGKLRPGMFASVYLETDTHENALVIPKAALVLDSIGDTVFIMDGDTAARREVRLGFRETDVVEVLEGLEDGDQIIVLGQDGLSDGTPVILLDRKIPSAVTMQESMGPGGTGGAQAGGPGRGPGPGGKRKGGGQGGPPGGGRKGGGSRGGPGFLKDATPEELETARERMRQRGLNEDEIEERIKAARE